MRDESDVGSGNKPPRRERLVGVWDRALQWMHDYLAFDVQPRRRVRPPDIREIAAGAKLPPRTQPDDRLPSASWRLASETDKTHEKFAPGKRVADTYEIVRLIAVGDISTTYLVRHQHGRGEFALRVPHPQLVSIPGATEQFAARAEQWRAIGPHPNIALCYHVQPWDGTPLVVAEFVEGVTLRQWSSGNPADRLLQGLDLAIQVCQALEHAHHRRIGHGACTPDNIMITSDGVAKLRDFGAPLRAPTDHAEALRVAGIGHDTVQLYALAALMRAAPYVAPERWRQPTLLAPTADVFALGVSLWELFTGRCPYESTAVQRPPAPRPPALGQAEAHTRLAMLLERSVAWDPATRPSRVEEVRAELSAIYEALCGRVPERHLPEISEADRLNASAINALYGGKWAEANKAWDAALELEPNHLNSVVNRSIARWWHGTIDDEALIEGLENLALQGSEAWQVRGLIGLTHFDRGDLEAAEANLEQAVQQRPSAVELTDALERVRDHRRRLERSALAEKDWGFVSAVDLCAQGKIALSGCDQATAAVWDVGSGACLRVLEGHDGPVTAAVLSADGRAALTGGADGTVRVWHVEDGACRRVIKVASRQVVSLSPSRDGNLLLWAAHWSSEQTEGCTIELWDIRSAACVLRFEGLDAPVKSVVLSSDGRSAVSGGDDHLVRVWDLKTGENRPLPGHEHFVSSVSVSADGGLILSGSWDKTLRLWDTHTGRCLRVFGGHRSSVAAARLSADAAWAASGDFAGTLRIWEVATGRCLRTIHAHGGLVSAVAISATGHRGVSGSGDGTIRSWDTAIDRRESCRLRTTAIC